MRTPLPPLQVIPVESLEGWAAAMSDRSAVIEADAVLVLPNGQTWGMPVSGHERERRPRVAPEDYCRLESAMMDHASVADDEYRRFHHILFEWGKLDLTRAYCLTCEAWVDVAAAVTVVDEQGNREG